MEASQRFWGILCECQGHGQAGFLSGHGPWASQMHTPWPYCVRGMWAYAWWPDHGGPPAAAASGAQFHLCSEEAVGLDELSAPPNFNTL